MQTNTVETRNRAVNFSNPSEEKEGHRSDPFTVRDGRYVGSDGFVVPKDFREFFERFPNYVRQWVSKHDGTSAPEEGLEDWTQDLLMHLSSLPRTSKYREAGKEDIVATFDPLRHYGANEARFRNYINLCLANKFRTMHSKRTKDALCRTGNLSFDVQIRDEAGCADDEYCHSHSARLKAATKAAERQVGERVFLREFWRFAPPAPAALAQRRRCAAPMFQRTSALAPLSVGTSNRRSAEFTLAQEARSFEFKP